MQQPVKRKQKIMIFLRHHIHEDLKSQYLIVKDSHTLWNKLKEMYDHLKFVHLPRARYNWIHLRLQDFKSLSDYNSELVQSCCYVERKLLI